MVKGLYLLKVVNRKGQWTLFTPLLEDFVKSTLPQKFAPKETQLLNLLKKKMGKVVSKDELFETLWKDDLDSATNWALNALIYRLRKNPSFIGKGYVIENYKKIGYMLVRV